MNFFNLKKTISALLVVLSTSMSFAQAVAFCPSISAFTSTVPLCQGNCATLNANVIPVNQTTSYSVQSIPYFPFSYSGGTPVSVGIDDVWSNVINLGFNFCYFGNTYNKCLLGSNGQLTFSLTSPLPGGYDNWAITTAIPSLNDMPGNTISAVFRDIDPSFGGSMAYYFSGTSPCRALVIYWDSIPLYSNPGSCSGKPNSKFQLVLYENTNFIDVYIQNSTACTNWNGGKGIVGIQNAAGTVAYSPPSRNFPTVWTATNEAWRFVPTGPQSYTVTWSGPSGIIGTGLTQTVCPSSTTNYTASMNVTSCSGVNSTYTSAVTVTVSPNPPPIITPGSITQLSCSSPTNSAAVILSSGTPGYTVNWFPASTITGSTATTYSVSGMSVGTNTVTVVDASGCTATQTIDVTSSPAIPILSIGTPSGNVIGCNPNYLPLIAVNSSTNPLLAGATFTYNWAGPSTSSLNTGTFNVTAPGSYTLTGSATYTTAAGTVTSCIANSVISVTGSTLVPVCNVAPATRTLNCSGSCAQFTASCPSGTANIIGNWYSGPPQSTIVGPTGTPMLLCANAPGTYTAEFCSTISGCCSTQTVAVFPSSGMPTLSVTVSSFNGFTINCTNPKVIMNTNTSSLTGPFGYTWTPLPTPPGVGVPSTVGGYTATTPGQYEIKFIDGNLCPVSNTITVYIDTLRPSPFAVSNLPSNSFTINCYNPDLIATAQTAPMLSLSSYSWTQPSPLVTYPSNTINIGMINVTSNPTNYTVTALGPNGCIGKAKVQFYKDIAMPTYNPSFAPSIGITCGNPCVAMTPTPSTGPAINFTFTSPPPTQTATTAGALMCVPGPYTMVYQNIANGCTKTGTVFVPQNVIPPAVVAQAPIYLPCGQTTTVVSAGTTTSSSTYSYTWKPPIGAGMSCLGGTACATSSVNAPGVYQVFILNTMNGCYATNSVLVVAGGIQAGLNANPSSGFSPLSVNFDNTSQTGSTLNGTITAVWNFGNGITYTTSGSSTTYSASGLPGASTIYQSAGSYTVLLIVTQNNGTVTCTGTASTVVNVELPSKLTVPNVFTPNGDGVNDVFTLQTTNITNVTCQIFDRWGVKMYDVTSEKGNISWDGKNFGGKDAPSGTYFYILTAKGKDGLTTWNDADGKEIPQKGTISLYR